MYNKIKEFRFPENVFAKRNSVAALNAETGDKDMKKLISSVLAIPAAIAVCAIAPYAVTDDTAAQNTEEVFIIQTETLTEEDTEETDPPMTGETKIVYEPNQGLIKRVNLSDVSVPKGNPAVNTEADITNDIPVTDPETEESYGASTETSSDNKGEQTSRVTEKSEDKKEKKINKPAITALGSVAITAALISAGASTFHLIKKRRIKNSSTDDQNGDQSSKKDD